MSVLEDLLREIGASLAAARRFAGDRSFAASFDRYGVALAKLGTLAIVVETGLIPVTKARSEVTAAIARAYGSKALSSTDSSPILDLHARVTDEAIAFALAASRYLEAFSLTEILRTRRLFSELAKIQAREPVDAVVQSDFGLQGLTYIAAMEQCPTAILSFYISASQDLHAFMLRQDRGQFLCSHAMVADSRGLDALATTLAAYQETLRQDSLTVAESLLDGILAQLARPLSPLLLSLRTSQAQKLIICPYGVLHQIALHALKFADDDTYLIDHFPIIVYAPSLYMYAEIISDKKLPPRDSDVSGYFDFDTLDCGAAGLVFFHSLVNSPRLRIMTRAVRPNLEGSAIIHFDCHGLALDKDFMESSLLTGAHPLTFREILGGARTNALLVFLNACETGLSSASRIAIGDEYYGLDGAFLARGALNVVSTLAPVFDAPACLLEARFYLDLTRGRHDVGAALRHAQLWLRDGQWRRDQEVAELIGGLASAADSQSSSYLAERIRIAQRRLQSVIEAGASNEFAHPLHWAQWKCSGYGHSSPIPTADRVDGSPA